MRFSVINTCCTYSTDRGQNIYSHSVTLRVWTDIRPPVTRNDTYSRGAKTLDPTGFDKEKWALGVRFHSLSKPRVARRVMPRVAESMELLQRRSRPSSVAVLAVAAMVGAVLAVSQSQQSTVNSVNGQCLLSYTSWSTASKLSQGPPGGSTQRLTTCTPHSASPARRASPHANSRDAYACLMLSTRIARRALILYCCVCARPQATC